MNNKQLLLLTALLSMAHVSLSAVAQDRKDDSPATTQQPIRIFQTLPNDPSEMSPTELSELHRRLRATRAMVFGGGNANNNNTHQDTTNFRPTLEVYTPAERRDYLVKKGKYCYPPNTNIESSMQWDDVLSRYDSLMIMSGDGDAMTEPNGNNNSNNNDSNYQASRGLERLATELWKHCLLYNGDGHVYLGYEEAQLLYPLQTVLCDANSNYGVVSVEGSNDSNNNQYLHDSFMAISPNNPAKVELSTMIRVLLETSNDVLGLHPMLPSKMMHQVIAGSSSAGDDADMSSSWTLLQSHCIDLAKGTQSGSEISPIESTIGSSGSIYSNFQLSSSSRSLTLPLKMGDTNSNPGQGVASCPLSSGGYCCLAFLSNGVSDSPVIALRHPLMSRVGGSSSSSSSHGSGLPYKLEAEASSKLGSTSRASKQTLNLGVVPSTDLPYISTVRLLHNHTASMPTSPATRFPSHPANSPNFFDILFENDCLPYRKQCHRCLKDVSNEAHLKSQGEEGATQTKRKLDGQQMDNACSKCQLECPCYCDVLCKVRPLPKEVVRTYAVNPPQYKKAVDRLVPKIIHQTWFEPVTKEKYPNFSRLIESWKKSGWEYYFYDDESAREFLSTHFPPEVGEAYDSITPGAFKADLFRYCVLLIRGGVYADIDVLIETNLDDAIADDVGFMTPIDEPGVDVGHRSCLWNGFIASAPGHPFLVRTIEIVVNNIRNRFTSVDYDDMLCPNPILSVSHTVDTLFTCGPCILGAGINNLLGLHMQNQFEVGDVDIWQSERSQQKSDESVSVRPDDPRLLIPGRTIILEQNKNDMGAHRFTLSDRHIIVAATDMPDYDDRPSTKEHYSKTHEQAGVYGIRKLYTDTKRANEEIRFVVESL